MLSPFVRHRSHLRVLPLKQRARAESETHAKLIFLTRRPELKGKAELSFICRICLQEYVQMVDC